MLNISEGNFSGEQNIDDAQEFISSCDDGFFMFHPLFPFSFVVSAKHLGIKNSADGHMPDGSAQMSVAPFGNFELAFKFSRFIDDWVNSCISDDFLMGGKGIKSWNFSDEVSGRQIADAPDRSQNIHRFWITGIYFFNESRIDGGQFFCQLEESFDTAFQDFFPVIVINTDGIMSDFHNFISGKFYFSASTGGDFFDDFGDFFLTQFAGDTCRRDREQEIKHGLGEDIMFTAQLVKDIEGDLFNSGFEFRDFTGDCFAFSGKEINSISGGVVFDFIRVFEQESGDSFCRDFVGFCFSQGATLLELFDKQWIKERDVVALSAEEIKNVDVVAAGGFNTDGEVLWVSDGLQAYQEFIKFFFGLEESFFGNDFFLGVKDTEVQGIKGCIYANRIFRHGSTSFLVKKNGNRELSLPSSIMIRDLCPNQLIGNGESRGQTPSRALGPGRMSSPCFQSLSFISVSSLIISKLYPNST